MALRNLLTPVSQPRNRGLTPAVATSLTGQDQAPTGKRGDPPPNSALTSFAASNKDTEVDHVGR